jgi:hypothetical protein
MSDIRDVTPRFPLRESVHTVLQFLRHPLREVTRLPDWQWPWLLLVTICVSMISGVISGFIPPNIYRIAAGLVVSPIVGLVMNSVMSCFLYYYFQVFERRTVSLRKLFTLVMFSGIPFYIFQTISDLIWIITPVGFAFTALIMVVGLVENFSLDKKHAIRLVATILVLTMLVWTWNRVDISRLERSVGSAPSASGDL